MGKEQKSKVKSVNMQEDEKTVGLAKFRILEILKNETDRNHPMRQVDMLKRLEEEGRNIDRKTVKRNLLKLRDELNYDIEFDDQNRFWLNKNDFDNTELRLLMDSIQSNAYLSDEDKANLVWKVSLLGNKYFKTRMKNVISGDPSKVRLANDLYSNIEIIDEAITLNKKISFINNEYGADKKLHPVKDHHTRFKGGYQELSPYKIIYKNERYYVVGGDLYISELFPNGHLVMESYPLDLLTDVDITFEDSVPLNRPGGYKNPDEYFRQLLESPEIKDVARHGTEKYELLVGGRDLEVVLTSFGNDIYIKKIPREEKEKYWQEYHPATYLVIVETDFESLLQFAYGNSSRIYIRDSFVRSLLVRMHMRALCDITSKTYQELQEIFPESRAKSK